MRPIYALPLAAAILLAACGDGGDADGDGAVSGDELAAEAAGAVQPQPGQYRGSFELLGFEAPGLTDAAKQQMQQLFGSGLTQGIEFCITEQDIAGNGPEQMVKNLAEGDCTTKSFNVSGGSIESEMQCPGEGGGTRTVKINGQMTASSSDMTMETSQDMPGMGETNMKMRVRSERIGDCPA